MPLDLSVSLSDTILKAQGRLSATKEAAVVAKSRKEAEITKIEKLRVDQERYRKAVLVTEKVIETARSNVINRFEDVITLALRTVFDASYCFKIECSNKWNQPTADFKVISDGLSEPVDPLDAKGGGVVDVISVGLKFALLNILNVDGFLMMDEPMKHLNAERAPTAGEFLSLISKGNKRQIIMATHQSAFKEIADNEIGL